MRYEQQWEACLCDGISGEPGDWFPATVPGNVQEDYARFRGWDDLNYATETRKLAETESCAFDYRTRLSYECPSDGRVFFVTEGIDYAFDVYLDGILLGSREGMFTPAEWDVTESVRAGSVLQIHVHPHPQQPGGRSGTGREASHSCKPPVSYGWDWNPRLVISGLWQPAYLEVRRPGHLRRCEVRYALDLELRRAQVWIEADSDRPIQRVTLKDPVGRTVYDGRDTTFTLEKIALWWCNGWGEPNLYTWRVETDGDVREGTVGFKQLRLQRNAGRPDEVRRFPVSGFEAPATVELNGCRLFAKGSNFVNPELFHGRMTRETYEPLVKKAKEAHMNILRMWGGSGIQKDAFYELCDQNGILVWQEFMLSCADYQGTPHYLHVLEQEATSVILALRHHVCLAFWCGGNELFNYWEGMSEQSLPLRLLDKLCYELDWDRPFLMTSPVGRMAHGGYTFRYADGRDVFQAFREARGTAYSEFGVPGFSDPDRLRQIIPAEELFPIRPTENWRHHFAFDALGPNCWGCLDILEDYFGPFESLEETVQHSQWLQAVGYQAIFEEARRQWPYCSMALNWDFNEPCVTAANNSLLMYPAAPRPAYEAVKQALRPVMASAGLAKFVWREGERLAVDLWYLNDSPAPVSDTVTVTVSLGEQNETLMTWETGTVAARHNKQGPTGYWTLPQDGTADRITVTLRTEREGSENMYTVLYRRRSKR